MTADSDVLTTAVVAVPLTREFIVGTFEVASFVAIDYWTDDHQIFQPEGRASFIVTVQADLFDAIPADPNGLRSTVHSSKPRTFVIRPTDLGDAYTRIAMGRVQVRSDIVTSIRTALFEGDTGEIDAEAADVLVQVAAWGSIVFG